MAQTVADYHEKTSYDRSSMGGHYLDWQNQPNVFKTYDGLKPFPCRAECRFP
ncbi:conserved hypothetical protein [delta proteobacterium NaphS2]|nr:conserved hypothetical protein [delta proteobacterium NaphS2]